MPYRNRRHYVDVANKTGPEFEYWLSSNVSDRCYRDWYRADRTAREEWLNKLEQDINQEKRQQDLRKKWLERR